MRRGGRGQRKQTSAAGDPGARPGTGVSVFAEAQSPQSVASERILHEAGMALAAQIIAKLSRTGVVAGLARLFQLLELVGDLLEIVGFKIVGRDRDGIVGWNHFQPHFEPLVIDDLAAHITRKMKHGRRPEPQLRPAADQPRRRWSVRETGADVRSILSTNQEPGKA